MCVIVAFSLPPCYAWLPARHSWYPLILHFLPKLYELRNKFTFGNTAKMAKGFHENPRKIRKKDKVFVIFFCWIGTCCLCREVKTSAKMPKFQSPAKLPKPSGTIRQLSDKLISQVSTLQTLLNGVTLSSSHNPPEKASGHDRHYQERLPLSPAFPNGPFSCDGDAEGFRTRPLMRGRPGCLEERGWVY